MELKKQPTYDDFEQSEVTVGEQPTTGQFMPTSAPAG